MNKKDKISFLKRPTTILAAIAIAIIIGILGSKGSITTDVAERSIYDWLHVGIMVLKPVGDMYLNLIKMTVYPIMVTAITSSIAGLVKSPEIGEYLSRMLRCFILMLLLTAALGTIIGVIGKPGAGLSHEARTTLNESIEQSVYKADIEVSLAEDEVVEARKTSFMSFIINVIPENIFKSLADGLALQLVLFSILFGIAIGVVRGHQSESLVMVMEGLFKALQTIINWLMYLLPFGLIFLLAGQIASSQEFFEVLRAMIRFIVLFYIAGCIILIINSFIIWRRSKESLFTVLKEQLDPIMIALATRSSFATLPSAIKALNQRLGFYENITKLYIPLGITIGRFGSIIYFAISALFVTQLYDVPMTAGSIFIVFIGSIFAGTATAGATGLATLGLMSIVLDPLGLPLEAVLILFMTIDTIIDPMRTLLIVHSNMAVNALVASKSGKGNRRKSVRSLDDLETNSERGLLDEIQKKGEIIVAVKRNEEPLFHYSLSNGEMGGIDIQLAKKIASSLDVKLKIDIESGTEEDLLRKIQSGNADIIVSRINKNTIRDNNSIAFSTPYAVSRRAFLINHSLVKDVKNMKSLMQNFEGHVGINKNSSYIASALRIFPKAKVVQFSDYPALLVAFFNGSVTFAYGSEIDFIYAKKRLRNNKQSKKMNIVTLRNVIDQYVMVIPNSHKSLLFILNNAASEENAVSITADNFIDRYQKPPQQK